jgi:hypothetical protein
MSSLLYDFSQSLEAQSTRCKQQLNIEPDEQEITLQTIMSHHYPEKRTSPAPDRFKRHDSKACQNPNPEKKNDFFFI